MKNAERQIAKTIEAIWRIEATKVVAAVAKLTRELGSAEDFAQDALVAALETWPAAGVPDNPGAWLTTTARRRALDRLRHERIAAPCLPASVEEPHGNQRCVE
jgi:predicted RNA polymerase sigma factor